jgi:hypothetical protein
MSDTQVSRYRRLFVQMGDQRARALLDRLQVLALTQPDALREFMTFIERDRSSHYEPLPDRAVDPRRDPEHQ